MKCLLRALVRGPMPGPAPTTRREGGASGGVVVAAPDEPVALRVLPHCGQAAVSVDGRRRGVLDPGDGIGVFRAPHRVRLVRLRPTDFYGRLRERFRLAAAPATAVDGPSAPFFRPDTPIPPDLARMRLPPPTAAR